LAARDSDEDKYNTIRHSAVSAMTIEISFLNCINNNNNNNNITNNSDSIKLLKSIKYFQKYIKECTKYYGQLKTSKNKEVITLIKFYLFHFYRRIANFSVQC